MLKINKLCAIFMASLSLLIATKVTAQDDSDNRITTLRLEARADFDYNRSTDGSSETYGFYGRYFNLHMGGNLSNKVSYYLRQRIIADNGTHNFFDNTDFLYINYMPNEHWRFRLGKDAMAIGGFEYDAAPIDVYYNGVYWDNFYCFQLGASLAYLTNEGKHSLVAQVTNTPYNGFGADWGNFSYNLMWAGHMGHFHTLWSASVFDKGLATSAPGDRLAYFAAGNKLAFDHWNMYVDLMAHYDNSDIVYRSMVARLELRFNEGWSLFGKGVYEEGTGVIEDIFFPYDGRRAMAGVGFENHPRYCRDLRYHAYVAFEKTSNGVNGGYEGISANVGLTWNINVLKSLERRYNW